MSPSSPYLRFRDHERAVDAALYENLTAPARPRHRNKEGISRRRYRLKFMRALNTHEFRPSSHVFLYANNPQARVRFARIFLDGITRHLQHPTDDNELRYQTYLVTFALKRFCCSVAEAETYDLRPLQAWVRQVMEGLSYLGMVEAAFYSNVSPTGGLHLPPEMSEGAKEKRSVRDRRQTISWHVHLLVWNVSRPILKTLVDEVCAKHVSLIPGLPSADYRQIQPEHLESKALYMLKSPQEYRVWPKKTEVIDLDTGEITVLPTGRFRQKSRKLRRGDQLRMFRVLHDRYLDHLMLGGGAGRDLLLSIRKEALRPLRSRERR